jgi:uncharacterized membrane protein
MSTACGAGAADLQLQFKAWAVTCAGDRYCTAATRLKGSGEVPYAFRLRVSRYQSGEREIVFLPARDRPAADASLSVRVDRKPPVMLAPGTGYRAVGGGNGNTYVVADAEATAALIEAMRTGKLVEFSYRSAQSKPVAASFPLEGFAPALAVVDPQYARAAPAKVPAPPAPAEGPPAARTDASSAPTTAASEDLAMPHSPTRSTVEPPPSPEPAKPSSGPPAPVSSVTTPAPNPKPAAKPARTAAAGPPPPGRKRQRAVREFSCRGNEPAWNFVIDNDQARFELLLGGPAPEAIAIKGKLGVTGEGRTPDIDWRGKAADGRAYRALIQQQQCADSMSDAEGQTGFDYRVRLTVPGGRVLEGCCNAGLEPVRPKPTAAAAPAAPSEPAGQSDPAQAPLAILQMRPPTDWSRMLMELMPAIDACLARTPGSAPYVTKAWVATLDTVVVRTRNATVGWFECAARSDGSAIDAFHAVESSAPSVVGEEVVLYTPVTSAPPAGNCFTHARVVDQRGEQIGWLSDNTCAAQRAPAKR